MEFNDYLRLAELPAEPYTFKVTVTESFSTDVLLRVDLGTVKSAWVCMAFKCAILRQPDRAVPERQCIEFYADSQMWKAYKQVCRLNGWEFLTQPEKRGLDVS